MVRLISVALTRLLQSSPAYLTVLACVIVFLAEILAMCVVTHLQGGSINVFILVDALLVTVLVFLPLYALFILPINRLMVERHAAEALQQEDRRKLETLMANFPGMAYRMIGESDARLDYVSDGCMSLTGYRPAELITDGGQVSYQTVIHPRDQQRVLQTRQLAVQHGLPFQIEYRLCTVAGAEKWVWEQGCGVLDHDGNVLEINGFILDVNEWKETQQLLEKSRDHYLALFESFPALIWRANIGSGRDYFNTAWFAFTGMTHDDAEGDGWMHGVHAEDLEQCQTTYLDAFAKRQPFRAEYRLRHGDGSYRWVLDFGHPYYGLEGQFAGYIGSCYDITDQKQLTVDLSHQATHDVLTGLPNRRVYEEAVERAIIHARHGATSVLLFMDVDYFKTINDSFGHAIGDETLQAVTRVMHDRLRGGDVLARVGGDEFAVLLDGVGVQEGQMIALRIGAGVRALPYPDVASARCLSLSIGLTLVDGTLCYDELMTQVDGAMYQAKAQGRDCVINAADLRIPLTS